LAASHSGVTKGPGNTAACASPMTELSMAIPQRKNRCINIGLIIYGAL
jgi:hypothetical protein